MAESERQYVTHRAAVAAPADTVYGIVATATEWPVHFAPSIHVERTGLPDGAERLRMWATANGEVKGWTSRRELDPARRRVTFRQEVSTPPVASMGGAWTVTPDGEGCVLTLEHDFTAVSDAPADLDWVATATDRNSTVELANIAALAQDWAHRAELTCTFSDAVEISGDADAAYDFLYRADLWPERLPHVSGLELREDVPNQQVMSMVTLGRDGSTHTTESVRICFPDERRIVYKQLVAPSLMAVHTGVWTVERTATGVLATSAHTVVLNPDTIAGVLGADATVADARDAVRAGAGGNSLATLELVRRAVETGTAAETV